MLSIEQLRIIITHSFDNKNISKVPKPLDRSMNVVNGCLILLLYFPDYSMEMQSNMLFILNIRVLCKLNGM